MKIVVIVLGIIALGVVAHILFFPSDRIIIFPTPRGGNIAFSRFDVSVEPPPDRFATNGFDHIEPYISRMLVPSEKFKSISFFTPDGNRGFGLHARDGNVEATLTLEWRQEAQRESAVRSFFESRGIAPSEDYLAGNGDVPDATRCLTYPIAGTAQELTALTQRILQRLYGISPTEALNIQFMSN